MSAFGGSVVATFFLGFVGVAAAQPVVEMPPEGATASQPAIVQLTPGPPSASRPDLQLGAGTVTDETLVRGLGVARAEAATVATGGSGVLGGYGEITLGFRATGPDAPLRGQASVRRLVLSFARELAPGWRVYGELEWENAIACSSCQGAVEVEQAYAEWAAFEWLSIRAGLVLMPIGIVNQWHEPPVFHGVERPIVDQLVIPTTWRELGVGIAGRPVEWLRYELYATTGLDPRRVNRAGLGEARSLGSVSPADGVAVVGRLETEPVPGLVFGLAGYGSEIGGIGSYFDESGIAVDLDFPVIGYAVDARMRRWGFEARAVVSQWFLPRAGALMAARRADGSTVVPPDDGGGAVPERIEGGYVELAYDVLHPFGITQQLLPFVRLERWDTQAAVPDGYRPNLARAADELTLGLSYRPIQQLVVKADLQLQDHDSGDDTLALNAGLGWMF